MPELTSRQKFVFDALCAAYVHDFRRGYSHVTPTRVAKVCGLSYNIVRPVLAQLRDLGFVTKADPREHYGVGRNLLYAPNWSTDGPQYGTEWDERMSHPPEFYCWGASNVL